VSGVIAVLAMDQGTFCTGVLVTPRVVLTARHCIAPIVNGEPIECSKTTFGSPSAPEHVYVVTASKTAIPTQRHSVTRVLVPDDPSFCGSDIAALVLPEPLDEVEAQPIPLRMDRDVEASESFTAVGFGRDGSIAPSGTRRRREDLRVTCVGLDCRSRQLTDAEWWGDGAVCEGDSGGPAIDAEGRVIGIASRKRDGCSATVYLDVARSSAFVASALGEAQYITLARDKGGSGCSTGGTGTGAPLAVVFALLAMRVLKSRRRIPPD